MFQYLNKEEWEKMALDIRFDGCLAKYEQNPNLRDFLLSTGTTVLLEASQFDLFLRTWIGN